MAVTEQRNLFNPQIEALAEKYTTAMGQRAATPFTEAQIGKMAPKVIDPVGLQQQASDLTAAGLGSYAPYMTAAQQAGTTAGAGLGLAQTGLGIAGQELTGAQGALGTAGTTTAGVSPYIGAAGTGLGTAGTTLGGVSPYITAAGTGLGAAAGLTGPMTGAQMATIDPTTGQTVTPTLAAGSFMSPYQSQVIDTTLQEFDRQAAMRQQAISDAAVAAGGFGGGREGVMQSEYQLGSDRNRAMIEAQLQQQGFGQAAGLRQQDLANQMMLSQGQLGLGQATGSLAQQQAQLAQGQLGLGQAQLGLGSAQAQQAGAQAGMAGQRAQLAQAQAGMAGQRGALAAQQAGLGQAQLGLGQYQTGLGGALQGFQGADIARAGQVGAADQAQIQAGIDAQTEFERMRLYEPYERLGFLGSGLTGLMGGMGPQYQFTNQPNPSPLATALGIGTSLGGAYLGGLGRGR